MCIRNQASEICVENLRHNGGMKLMSKQTFFYLVISACIAGFTTGVGTSHRIDLGKEICSRYIGGADIYRDLDSEFGQPKFITCDQLVEQYSKFPIQTWLLHTLLLQALICIVTDYARGKKWD